MRTLLELTLLAVGGLTLAVAAAAFAGGALPGIAILGNFAAYALIVAVLAAGVAAWRRWRAALLVGLAAVLANAALVVPALSSGPAIAEGSPALKLMLFNIRWNNTNFDGIDALIAQHDPDVVVLNEVYKNNRPGLRMLDARFPYRLECWTAWPCDTLILSRRPLRNSAMEIAHGETRLGVAQTQVEVGGCEVTLFGVHLNRPWPYHALSSDAAQFRQARALADLARDWPGPKIVVGDLNAAAWTPLVRELAAAVKGRALGGLSGTWPWFLPSFAKLPIDHVIVSGEIAGTRTVLAPTGSDHSPVLAELAVRECR
jgi:endonuclease/exonuclease/phosphatase (EEP) superfamily protein YafD